MPNQRILLIEDDAAIRRGVADALKFAGYYTMEAANVPDGLETARGADVDLILLDLVLPGAAGQGGLDILKDVRSSRPTVVSIPARARSISSSVMISGGVTRRTGVSPRASKWLRRTRGRRAWTAPARGSAKPPLNSTRLT